MPMTTRSVGSSPCLGHEAPWCIAKNGGGYTQRGVAKGLKVPCLFMITEVSIRCQKTPEVGIRRIRAYTPPQYTHCHEPVGGLTTEVCDAWPVRRHTYGYLSVRRAFPTVPTLPLWWWRGTWCVCTTCPRLLPVTGTTGSGAGDL